MLRSLSITNVVLIDRLHLDFEEGLCVLTGETGAGKSILLDALGLAMGARAEARLVRKDTDKATVIAVFDVPANGTLRAVLTESDIDDADGDTILRRTLTRDGRSRAYINDTPVSTSLLRRVAGLLIEIQGQQRGIMDSATHRALLDAMGAEMHNTLSLARETAKRWQDWQEHEQAKQSAEDSLAQARREEDFLRHAVEELDHAAPEDSESEQLATRRQRLLHHEKMTQALNNCLIALGATGDSDNTAEAHLLSAQRFIDQAIMTAGEALAPAREALERCLLDVQEAALHIQRTSSEWGDDSQNLQEIEERYFLLQDLARKHRVAADELPKLRITLTQKLALIKTGTATLDDLNNKATQAKSAYRKTAQALSTARRAAACDLDRAITAELPPLRLERARFATEVTTSDDPADWNSHGQDQVIFNVSTNPGSAPGPLEKIASGGELGRFLLAFKVILSRVTPSASLVFDEVDSGLGGATAHAVGKRLAHLAAQRQVLVITHSPQVAAKAQQHLRVSKISEQDAGGHETTLTDVIPLSPAEREDEIARMLAGAEITESARAAARTLLDRQT